MLGGKGSTTLALIGLPPRALQPMVLSITYNYNSDILALSDNQEAFPVTKWLLIALQIIYLCSLLAWFAIWGLSFMAFDSDVSTLAVLFVSLITAYPVLVIGCVITSWFLYRKSKMRTATVVNLVPLMYIVAFAALMFLISIFPH